MVRSAIKNTEIDQKRALDDDEVLDILQGVRSNNAKIPAGIHESSRDDLVADVQAEIAIISEYLPQPMTEEEIKAVVQQTLQEVGASSKAGYG